MKAKVVPEVECVFLLEETRRHFDAEIDDDSRLTNGAEMEGTGNLDRRRRRILKSWIMAHDPWEEISHWNTDTNYNGKYQSGFPKIVI